MDFESGLNPLMPLTKFIALKDYFVTNDPILEIQDFFLTTANYLRKSQIDG